MRYPASSVAHFQAGLPRSNSSGMLALLLAAILLGACTQAELRGEGKEEAIFPGESATGRTIPYIPDPSAVMSSEAFADAEEVIFPAESATGRTIPYVSEPSPAESPELPKLPELQEVTAEIPAEDLSESPKISAAVVVAIQTTTQEESLTVLEEEIVPEKVLFPDADDETNLEEETIVTIDEKADLKEELIGLNGEEAASEAEGESGAETEIVGTTEEAAAAGEEAGSEVEPIDLNGKEVASTTETVVAATDKSGLPEDMPFAVVDRTLSEDSGFGEYNKVNSGEILVADEEQTDFASDEMFAAVDETTIPGATTNAVLTAAAIVADNSFPEQNHADVSPVSTATKPPESAPGSGFGHALAFGGGLGGTEETTYPSKGEFGRYEPAPDPDNPPKGIFGGTKGIPLFPDVFGQTEPDDRSNISINSFLWRAALETLSFLPLDSADPFGGVIITDWHSNPESPTERFKVVAYILDSSLRVGALRISVFRQEKSSAGAWQDATTDEDVHVQLENTILNRARELRIAWIEEQEG